MHISPNELENFKVGWSVYVDDCDNIRTYYNNQIVNMTHYPLRIVELWNDVICSVFYYILNQNWYNTMD